MPLDKPTQPGTTSGDDDRDLTNYLGFALARATGYYKLFFAILGVMTLLVIVYVHTSTPLYTAVAALTPPKDSLMDNSGMQGLNAYAGIAKTLGMGRLSSSSGDDLFDQYSRVLVSYRLSADLAQRPDFMKTAYGTSWDPKTKHLISGNSVMRTLVGAVKSVLGIPSNAMSDVDQVHRLLEQHLSISTPSVAKTDISEVSFRFDDQQAAQTLLRIILDEADTLVRNERRRDIAARIAYLRDQLSSMTLDAQREATISLLALQQNNMMVIAADRHYAMNIVELPYAPQKPTWPSGMAVIGLIGFLTFVTWAVLILILPESSTLLVRFSRKNRVLVWNRYGIPRPNVGIRHREI